jgi:L-asparagine transporter-like permease
MDQAEIAKQFETRVKKNVSQFSVFLMAAVVALMALLAIIPRWTTFSSVAKFDAVIFLFLLLTNPVLDFIAEKKGSVGRGRFRDSLMGYVLTMLAIMLFAQH